MSTTTKHKIIRRFEDGRGDNCPVCYSNTKGCSECDNLAVNCRGEHQNQDYEVVDDPGFNDFKVYKLKSTRTAPNGRATNPKRTSSNGTAHANGTHQDQKGSEPTNWAKKASEFCGDFFNSNRADVAKYLGIPNDALSEIPLTGMEGFLGGHYVTTHPECDAGGQIIGIVVRNPSATRKHSCMTGGSRGLSIPANWSNKPGPLFVTEGATCTLAMSGAGLAAIGRPGKDGKTEMLIAYIRKHVPAEREIVLIIENDKKKDSNEWPGRGATLKVAKQLADALDRPIRCGYTPDGIKDPRDWLSHPDRGDTPYTERGRILAEKILASSSPELPPPVRPLKNYQLGGPTGREKVPRWIGDIHAEILERTDGWPKRVDSNLFVRGVNDSVMWLDKQHSLFAWLDSTLGRPSFCALDWAGEAGCPSKSEVLARCQQHAERFDTVESFPHHRNIKGVYYIHQDPKPTGGSALIELVNLFRPATEEDGDLIWLFFLTLFWGGPPGSRPLFLFEAEENAEDGGASSGKSSIVHAAADLCGGYIGYSQKDEIDGMRKRMLSPKGREKRIALFDNVRSDALDDNDLESLITAKSISGHQMYQGEGERPNLITWVMTGNGVKLDFDLASRAVVIRIKPAKMLVEWKQSLDRLIATRRWEIIGDCLDVLRTRRHTPASGELLPGEKNLRWTDWAAEVVGTMPNYASLIRRILSRQLTIAADGDHYEAAITVIREVLTEKVGTTTDLDNVHIFIPSKVFADKVARNFSRSHAFHIQNRAYNTKMKKYPHLQCNKEFGKSNRRGFIWKGKNCSDEFECTEWEKL